MKGWIPFCQERMILFKATSSALYCKASSWALGSKPEGENPLKIWSALGSSYHIGLTGRALGMELGQGDSSSQERVSAGNGQVSPFLAMMSLTCSSLMRPLIFMKTL